MKQNDNRIFMTINIDGYNVISISVGYIYLYIIIINKKTSKNKNRTQCSTWSISIPCCNSATSIRTSWSVKAAKRSTPTSSIGHHGILKIRGHIGRKSNGHQRARACPRIKRLHSDVGRRHPGPLCYHVMRNYYDSIGFDM